MSVRIQSVMHVNVNCADLARSLRFYQAVLGLASGSHTNPVPQDGDGFGLPGRVQWDAHILQDARGFAGPGIDLLEWKQPPPEGRPYASAAQPGFSAVRLELPSREALESASAAAARAGGGAEPSAPETEDARGALSLRDPDGTRLWLEERPGIDGSRLAGVRVSCRDRAASRDWYERVLGLETRDEALSGGRGEGAWSASRLWPAGQGAFAIDLVEWERPAAGEAYPVANHLGIYRMAFLVEDMRESHAALLDAGARCPEPVHLDMGPEIPIDGLWACFFPDPDGTCLELIESPKL